MICLFSDRENRRDPLYFAVTDIDIFKINCYITVYFFNQEILVDFHDEMNDTKRRYRYSDACLTLVLSLGPKAK